MPFWWTWFDFQLNGKGQTISGHKQTNNQSNNPKINTRTCVSLQYISEQNMMFIMMKGPRGTQNIKPKLLNCRKCVKSMFIFALQISLSYEVVKFPYLFNYEEKENWKHLLLFENFFKRVQIMTWTSVLLTSFWNVFKFWIGFNWKLSLWSHFSSGLLSGFERPEEKVIDINKI